MTSRKFTLEGNNLIKGLAYSSQLRCASVKDFMSEASTYFEGMFYTKKDLAKRIDEVINLLSVKKGPVGEKKALELLIIRDLESIKRTLSLAGVKDPVKGLFKDFEIYKKILASYGIDLSGIRIFLVDSFPYPYTTRNFLALNCDVDDEKEFGIPVGVYFKKANITPLLSSKVLAHELVHACFSKIRTGRLARGLEDGLCDLIGLFLCSRTLGFDMAKNILLNLRLSYPLSQSRQIYVEALRQAVLIYKGYGLKGLTQILELGNKKGRHIIKEIEEKCIRGKYSVLPLKKGGGTADLNNFSNYFMGFPFSIVVSPLACYIAEKTRAGSSVEELIRKYNISPQEGRRAIKELNERVFLIVIANDRITYDETKTYTKTGTLRYAIRPLS